MYSSPAGLGLAKASPRGFLFIYRDSVEIQDSRIDNIRDLVRTTAKGFNEGFLRFEPLILAPLTGLKDALMVQELPEDSGER
jgi:hypothetical protein